MQKKLTQMLHMEREPVGIYFANTTAVCDMDANPETRNCVIPLLMKVSEGQIISMDEKSCNCAGGATGCCFGDGFTRLNPSIAKLLSQGYGENAPPQMPAFMKEGERFFCTEEVAECFSRIIANREAPKVEPMVDGYIRFLCLDKNDMPKVALHWEKYLEHIVEKYNKIYRIQMPKVTPHVCRHTFCSNMAKSGMNPKTLQYIMGHSDISVTLNVYTHVNFDDAKAEVLRVANG